MSTNLSDRIMNAFEELTLLRLSVALIVMVIVLIVAIGVLRVREAQAEYRMAVDQIEGIRALTESDEIYSLTQDDMAWLESEFIEIQERIDRIESLSQLPFGIDAAFEKTPWISPRYQAAMETLGVGRMFAEAGQVIANIGEEALIALDDNGIRKESGVDGDTWLDVLQRRQAELNDALALMDDATELRAGIEEGYLPSGVSFRLQQIDAVLDRFSEQRERANDLPLAFDALGAERTVRYLVLFQNPAETRPTGGFVGTVAFVEVERGQILDYTFHDVYELSQDYQQTSTNPIDPPWAIAEWVRGDRLQYQDANWWPHFPRTANMYITMTQEAGWGEVDSVVAVQPEAITDLLQVTGPIEVDVDGEIREITAENLEEEAERQRALQRAGGETESTHKEVIALIGEVLLDHLADSEREEMIDAAFLMFDALDRRDIQAYHLSEPVQTFLEERNWAGLIRPLENTPTLGATFANVTGLKTSPYMQPFMRLRVLEPDSPGVSEAVLTLSLQHLGSEHEDPFYQGFQRWWIDTRLPEGSAVLGSIPPPLQDPHASNGGAFGVDLDVGEHRAIDIRFTTREFEELLFRRQPGVRPVRVTIDYYSCDDHLQFTLNEDRIIQFDGACPVLQEVDEDVYSGQETEAREGESE